MRFVRCKFCLYSYTCGEWLETVLWDYILSSREVRVQPGRLVSCDFGQLFGRVIHASRYDALNEVSVDIRNFGHVRGFLIWDCIRTATLILLIYCWHYRPDVPCLNIIRKTGAIVHGQKISLHEIENLLKFEVVYGAAESTTHHLKEMGL